MLRFFVILLISFLTTNVSGKDSPESKPDPNTPSFHYRKGTRIIPSCTSENFKEVGGFVKGVAWVRDMRDEYYYVRTDCTPVTRIRFQHAGNFDDFGFAPVKFDKKMFWLKAENGKIDVPVRSSRSQHKITCTKPGSCYHYDSKTLAPAYHERHSLVGPIASDGLFRTRDDGREYHSKIVNGRSMAIYDVTYEDVCDAFTNGYCEAKEGREWFHIEKQGNRVYPGHWYHEVAPVQHTRIGVRTLRKTARKNKWTTEKEDAYIARARWGKRWTFIRLDSEKNPGGRAFPGKVSYWSLEPVANGYAVACWRKNRCFHVSAMNGRPAYRQTFLSVDDFNSRGIAEVETWRRNPKTRKREVVTIKINTSGKEVSH